MDVTEERNAQSLESQTATLQGLSTELELLVEGSQSPARPDTRIAPRGSQSTGPAAG